MTPCVVEARPASSTALAAKVAKLRREVDSLATKLRDRRKALRDELTALRAEKSDLARRLRLERVREKTLQAIRDKRDARIEAVVNKQRDWIAPLKLAIAQTRAYLNTSLPFMRAARLAALDRVQKRLMSARPDAGRILGQLWRLIEQESAMGGEVQLAQQPVVLDGRRMLVDVARIGMALLYVRALKRVYGWAKKSANGWRFERLKAGPGKDVVVALFAALDKNRALGQQQLLLPPLSKIPRMAARRKANAKLANNLSR
jgi:hypothetical protein